MYKGLKVASTAPAINISGFKVSPNVSSFGYRGFNVYQIQIQEILDLDPETCIFQSLSGTYSQISGGTVLGTTSNDNEVFNAIQLGFMFKYNGVEYTRISVASNGFIVFGDTAVSSTVPISSAVTGASNNLVATLARDLKSRADGQLSYLLTGSAGSRVFTVQWKNYRRVPTATQNDVLNFQIKFCQGINEVHFVYGSITAVTSVTAASTQNGLRGNSNTQYFNRTTTTDWANTTAGTAATSNCTLSATVKPFSGLTFKFKPPVSGHPPLFVEVISPGNQSVVGSIFFIKVSWPPAQGEVTGYKVSLGTDNPPTDILQDVETTQLYYNIQTPLEYGSSYYITIVPYNQYGDAQNCPVYSFTTLEDPTINSYPYVQNFDSVVPPDLPLGWYTIDANNDNYTWETYGYIADSAPNSVRIRWSTMAMNDWLVMPPFILTEDKTYRLNFKYRGGSNTSTEKLALYQDTLPPTSSLANILWSDQNINSTSYKDGEIFFTPENTLTHYFGFKGYSNMNQFYLYIDTVTLDQIKDYDSEVIGAPTLSQQIQSLNIKAGVVNTMSTIIKNTGYNPITQCTVQYYSNSIILGSTTSIINSLSTLETASIPITFSVPTKGSYQYYAVLTVPGQTSFIRNTSSMLNFESFFEYDLRVTPEIGIGSTISAIDILSNPLYYRVTNEGWGNNNIGYTVYESYKTYPEGVLTASFTNVVPPHTFEFLAQESFEFQGLNSLETNRNYTVWLTVQFNGDQYTSDNQYNALIHLVD